MPVAALEAVAGDWSRDLGGDRSSGQLPRPVHGLSSSPSSHTGIVSDLPGRLSSGSSLAARGRGDACQRSLRNRPRSGSRLLQSPLPGGEGDWRLEACDRSLTLERLRLPVSSQSREVPYGSGEILFNAISPSSALAGDSRSPGIAGAVGSSRSSSDALIAVASEDALVPPSQTLPRFRWLCRRKRDGTCLGGW